MRDEAPELSFERRESVRVHAVVGGGVEVELTRYRGVGETRRPGGATAYCWSHVTGHDEVAALTPSWFHDGLAELTAPWAPEPAALPAQRAIGEAVALRAADLGWGRTELSLRHFDQRVVHGRTGTCREDRRRYATMGLQTAVPDRAGIGTRLVRRETATSEPDHLAWSEALDGLVEDLEAQRAEPDAEEVTAGEWPVVLGPGQCALFFHEVCGHPLEGDVVASGTSYLGPQLGRRVGPGCLTLHDDVSSPRSFARYALDDEGVPAATVPLIEAGVVTEPILDSSSAAALGRRSNGHGRRISYMYPAIPRQAHTAVSPDTGDAASLASGIRYGLLIQRMRLRHMSIATGDFSFYVTEGRVVRHGEIGPPVRECTLRGGGLTALRQVEAVGADAGGWLGGGGCGKLDQGPLIVSFEQPSVRIAALRVHPGLR
jgi:TldD protein